MEKRQQKNDGQAKETPVTYYKGHLKKDKSQRSNKGTKEYYLRSWEPALSGSSRKGQMKPLPNEVCWVPAIVPGSLPIPKFGLTSPKFFIGNLLCTMACTWHIP
jgi:hypothetical protein